VPSNVWCITVVVRPKVLKSERIVEPPIELHGVPVRQTPLSRALEHLVDHRGLPLHVVKSEKIAEPPIELYCFFQFAERSETASRILWIIVVFRPTSYDSSFR
jgi:hypothetical protein